MYKPLYKPNYNALCNLGTKTTNTNYETYVIWNHSLTVHELSRVIQNRSTSILTNYKWIKNSIEDLALVQNHCCTKPTQWKAPRIKFLRFFLMKSNVMSSQGENRFFSLWKITSDRSEILGMNFIWKDISQFMFTLYIEKLVFKFVKKLNRLYQSFNRLFFYDLENPASCTLKNSLLIYSLKKMFFKIY